MDLNKTITELRAERDRLAAVITQLEALSTGDGLVAALSTPRTRRGRKSMGPEERREVSARMKKYWAKRRNS